MVVVVVVLGGGGVGQSILQVKGKSKRSLSFLTVVRLLTSTVKDRRHANVCPFYLRCVCFFRGDGQSVLQVNPFTAQPCKISGLKSARTRLQTVYFPGPITKLLSVLCVLLQTLSRVMRKRKEKCSRI